MLLCVCKFDFELQYEIRMKTERTTVPTKMFLDLMVTNRQWLKPSERSIALSTKDLSYLHYNVVGQGILITPSAFRVSKFSGKFPKNPKTVEDAKCEPFKRKFGQLQEQNRIERTCLGPKFRQYEYSPCLFVCVFVCCS